MLDQTCGFVGALQPYRNIFMGPSFMKYVDWATLLCCCRNRVGINRNVCRPMSEDKGIMSGTGISPIEEKNNNENTVST